ncbi:hypothetical protein cypCar_00030464, partial [Cyprinus carpio]
TNSGNTSDLFPMSPRTLDSLMHNEAAEANPGPLESLTLDMEMSSDHPSPMREVFAASTVSDMDTCRNA